MSILFSGLLVQELDPLPKFSARTGRINVRRWKGMPAEIGIISDQATALGYDWDTDYEGPYMVIKVDYPEDDANNTDKPLVDDWELKRMLVEKDLWLIPKVQRELSKLNKFDDSVLSIALIKSDVEKLISGESTTMKPIFGSDGTITWEETDLSLLYIKNQIFATDPTISWDVISGLIGALAKGVRSKLIISNTLARSVITNKKSLLKATQTNVGGLFSTDNLISIEQVPSDVKFDLPVGYWLKSAPEVSKIEKSKWEIKQEYWFAEDYDRFSYDHEVTG